MWKIELTRLEEDSDNDENVFLSEWEMKNKKNFLYILFIILFLFVLYIYSNLQ